MLTSYWAQQSSIKSLKKHFFFLAYFSKSEIILHDLVLLQW